MTHTARDLNDVSAGIMKQGALHDLRNIKEALPNDRNVQQLERATTAFYDGLAELDAKLQEINEDTHLSEEGKQAKRAQAAEAWKATSAEQLATIETVTTTLVGQDKPLTIPPPAEDAALLEAKLGNARSDARMLLDGVADHHLADRMRELVERNADPIITYLLLGTEWGNNYIRSRSPNSQPNQISAPLLEWAHHRQQLFPRLLDDAGRKEWERRQRVAKVPRIQQVVHATREFAIRDRKLW